MTIGEKMKEARKERGLSQEQLAEQLIVSRAAVAKWESDKGIPDIENLKKISEFFEMSIDELVDHSPVMEQEKESTQKDYKEYYIPYIGKKCDIEMIDWNDGIAASYLLNQDENFIYYLTIGWKKKKVGALTKQYIKKVTCCSKKEKHRRNVNDFATIDMDYFINKTVDIFTEDKRFFSGILGEDTEMLGVGIVDMSEEHVTLISGRKVERKKVTKIETNYVE